MYQSAMSIPPRDCMGFVHQALKFGNATPTFSRRTLPSGNCPGPEHRYRAGQSGTERNRAGRLYCLYMENGRFTPDEIREIRSSRAPARVVAQKYGVSHPTILRIRDRLTYKHVPDHPDSGDTGQDSGKNLYLRMKALDLLGSLPSGYCPTIVTSPPLRLGDFSGFGNEPEEESSGYVRWQRAVITECLRVAGPEGVFLYHQMLGYSTSKVLDIKHQIVEGFPIRKVIIWNHSSSRSGRGSWASRATVPYSFIFVFTGSAWTILKENLRDVLSWGDIWDIAPVAEDNYSGLSPNIPGELADRCIALGKGTVLDPFAGEGSIPLAAMRAGRDWLACDMRTDLMRVFEERRLKAGWQI